MHTSQKLRKIVQYKNSKWQKSYSYYLLLHTEHQNIQYYVKNCVADITIFDDVWTIFNSFKLVCDDEQRHVSQDKGPHCFFLWIRI